MKYNSKVEEIKKEALSEYNKVVNLPNNQPKPILSEQPNDIPKEYFFKTNLKTNSVLWSIVVFLLRITGTVILIALSISIGLFYFDSLKFTVFDIRFFLLYLTCGVVFTFVMPFVLISGLLFRDPSNGNPPQVTSPITCFDHLKDVPSAFH